MSNLLEMQIMGYIGKDAELKVAGDKKQVINFSVAYTAKYKDRSGNESQTTTWVNCQWWTEKTAVLQYLKKGTHVYIEGQPGHRAWKNAQGEALSSLTCRVTKLLLIGGRNAVRESPVDKEEPIYAQSNPQNFDGPPVLNNLDDLPF